VCFVLVLVLNMGGCCRFDCWLGSIWWLCVAFSYLRVLVGGRRLVWVVVGGFLVTEGPLADMGSSVRLLIWNETKRVEGGDFLDSGEEAVEGWYFGSRKKE
jgi:hypothetical protein